MPEVLVLSPSFGRWSAAPHRLLQEAGLRVRHPVTQGPLSSEEIQDELGAAEAVILGLDQMDEAAISAATDLKVIAKHGVGVDNIDLGAAASRGIEVVNAPGMNYHAVADLVLGMILSLLRGLPSADASVRAGEWETFHGPEVRELTVGIVGYGRIGRAVAHRIHGFGASVCAYDPYAPSEAFAGVEQCHTLVDLLRVSDLVTLHLPGGQNGPLIGPVELRLLDGGYLINAARGDLVDEAAVAGALGQGRLRGYAADAFTQEPLTDSPLLEAPHTLFSPHIGAFTNATNQRMGEAVVEDIIAVLRGDVPTRTVLPAHVTG